MFSWKIEMPEAYASSFTPAMYRIFLSTTIAMQPVPVDPLADMLQRVMENVLF